MRYLTPIPQAMLAGLATWAMTAVGAAIVFAVRSVNRRLLDASLGFAAGVMIAATFWSLLAPAIALSAAAGDLKWVPALIGLLSGAAVIRLVDWLLPHVHPFSGEESAEGVKTQLDRTALFVLAITLHNIPEGLAVGVGFGAAAGGFPSATIGGAVALAIGIGLQNLPEGVAVAVPLRAEGLSRWRSFFYGQMSAWVEPLGAVLGAAAVVRLQSVLPYALSFAAGAMLFVVVEDAIPESQGGGHRDVATAGAVIGFALMMVLDVALG